MVGLAGFEPTTSSSRTKRSTRLSHSPPLSLLTFAENSQTNPRAGLIGSLSQPRRKEEDGMQGKPSQL